MLGYRTLFSVDADPSHVLDESIRAFRRWLDTKPNHRYDGDALEFGVPTRYGVDAAALMLEESQPDGSRAVRATLTEVNAAGRWTTRLTAATSRAGRPWVWVDVDGPAERSDGSGRRQWTSTPNLAKGLLSEFAALDGHAALEVRPRRAFPEDVDRIIDMICDPDRRGLLFLAGSDSTKPLQAWIEKVAEVLQDTAGLAAAYVLDEGATESLNRALLGTHGVPPGTIRTYKPGADPASEWDSRRHRILGRERLENDSPRFLRTFLGWRAREAAIEEPLPKSALRLDSRFQVLTNELLMAPLVTPRVSSLPTVTAGGDPVDSEAVVEFVPAASLTEEEVVEAAGDVVRGVETLTRLSALVGRALGREVHPDDLEQELVRLASSAATTDQLLTVRETLDALEDRAAQVERERDELRGQLEDEQLDHALTAEELVQAEAVRDRLRVELVSAGQGEKAWSVDGELATADTPDSFSIVIRRMSELPHLAFTGDESIVLELDYRDPIGVWAGKTWRVLMALNGYAEVKAAGRFSGSVETYLQNTPAGSPGFSKQRYASNESQSVRKNDGLRQAREFPVPIAVAPEGRVFMGAHFKITQSGLISPRLYYHDATGLDGKVYVGYIGPHLPTNSTN